MFKGLFFYFAKSDGMYFLINGTFQFYFCSQISKDCVLQSKVQDRFHQFLLNDFYPHDKIVQILCSFPPL